MATALVRKKTKEKAYARYPEIWYLCAQSSRDPKFFRIDGTRIRLFGKMKSMLAALKAERRDNRMPVLFILDLDLCEFALIETLKKTHSPLLSFIVVSSCNELAMIRLCMDAGAYDYLLKPVDSNILRVKVDRALGRSGGARRAKSSLGLELDLCNLNAVNGEGAIAELTKKEFKILLELFDNHPEEVSREALQRAVWKNVQVISKTLDVHLFRLRRKLEPLGFEIRFKMSLKFALVASSARVT
jgi:DNA-binding response OmpR family regulator